MRQGQQNRRGRGRSRKGQNPLTRSYESNGPEVKIRGTPAHVAEKYMSLARDAMASGDRVLAENFFQHAEHYNRIIMAYRDQQLNQSGEASSGRGRSGSQDDANESSDDFNDEEAEGMNGESGTVPGAEPQPSMRSLDDQPQSDSGNGGERRSNGRNSRNNGQRRGRGSGGQRGGGRQSADAASKAQPKDVASAGADAPAQAARFADSEDKPDFLSRPVPARRTRRTSRVSEDGAPSAPVESAASDES